MIEDRLLLYTRFLNDCLAFPSIQVQSFIVAITTLLPNHPVCLSVYSVLLSLKPHNNHILQMQFVSFFSY